MSAGGREVRRYLERKRALLRAHVEADGTIRHEPPADLAGMAALKGLEALVRAELGAARTAPADPVELARLAAPGRPETDGKEAAPKSASQAAAIAAHVIDRGIRAGASDLFIDIRGERARVGYKIHGRLIDDDTELDAETARRVVRAMWSRGGRDWDPSAPSDAAFTVKDASGRPTRVRGNSLVEETRGHAVACRLRNPKEVIPLARAGYLPEQRRAIERMAEASGGLLVIAGPTGSGKSTTLTAMVQAMPRSLRKIEIADPPEVYLDHCVHVTIGRRSDGGLEGLDRILGAVVRQNPDVLILGEIRDRLSAAAAMGMAQQGRRVYTSLHANGCAGVPPRLADFGIALNLLGFREFFSGCVSQQLVALLCPACSRPAGRDPAERAFERRFGPGVRFAGPGCGRCADGVTGQTLVAQVYPLVDDPGPAYALIRRGDFTGLARHMEREHQVRDKHAGAARLVARGRADPADVVRRIGRFPDAPIALEEDDAAPEDRP